MSKTLAELKLEKHELESSIRKQISEFVNNNQGVEISYISVDMVEISSDKKLVTKVSIEIKL